MATLKFADKCPDNPFQFTAAERNRIVNELRKSLQPPACDAKGRALPTCANYAHIGVFFDGTNNNKYFSTKEKSHSNVARLYDVFPGKGVLTEEQIRQTARVYYDGEWEKRTLPVPSTFAAKEKAEYFSEAQARKTMYRKIYIPGVGTPFRQVGDENDNEKSNRKGEALAKYGDARIVWAMLQVLSLLMSMSGQGEIQSEELNQIARQLGNRYMTESDLKYFFQNTIRQRYINRLKNNKLPQIEAVNLYVFGFSRGATAARSFCTRMRTYLAKLDIKFKINIKFLGLFDTVASVGSAHSSRILHGKEDGHHSWAAMDLMFPSGIDKTVHLVAAHEVRGSFPITSIASMTGEEIVFPGVHSDVGGGYAPTEQGKSVYVDTDTGKLSQIPLSVMYRKAVMAGCRSCCLRNGRMTRLKK